MNKGVVSVAYQKCEINEELRVMSKQEAIDEVKKVFKGNKKFISFCEVMIASTDNFVGISRTTVETNNYRWEKFLTLSIDFTYCKQGHKNELPGFKTIHYRKGSKRNPEFHDFIISTYTGEISEIKMEA
jgi:hypothetical protein